MTTYTQRLDELVRAMSGPLGNLAAAQAADAQNERWNRWLEIRQRIPGPKGLSDLLRWEACDEQKARAIAVLLVPQFDMLPFKWSLCNSPKNKGYPFLDIISVKDLSVDLQKFTGNVACLSFDYEVRHGNHERAGTLLQLMQRTIERLPLTCDVSSEMLKRLP